MSLNVNEQIEYKLTQFLERKNIPNMLFYGKPGSGKKTILNKFLLKFYQNETTMNTYVLYVDCALGKGIKFIREELKFFAKTNNCNKDFFKSIILLNADKLTVDAQSALRRCIELFSETNRFFIVVENLEQLQKPILSRFCHIYVNNINSDEKSNKSLHERNIDNIINNNNGLLKFKELRKKKLKTLLNKFKNETNETNDYVDLAKELYENAYSAYDIYNIVKNDNNYSYEDEMVYYICKNNVKSEVLLMAFYLFFLFRSNKKIEISEFIKYG